MWPKYWSFSFNISPSNEYSGLISFRIDWFDLLAVQGTLKRLLQPQSINSLTLSLLYGSILTSIHDYWEKHGFDFVGKAMSLLFNKLSRLVIAFLPRSMAVVIICSDFGAQEIKSVTVSIVSPSICHEVIGLDVMILIF